MWIHFLKCSFKHDLKNINNVANVRNEEKQIFVNKERHAILHIKSSKSKNNYTLKKKKCSACQTENLLEKIF